MGVAVTVLMGLFVPFSLLNMELNRGGQMQPASSHIKKQFLSEQWLIIASASTNNHGRVQTADSLVRSFTPPRIN